ncbi:MAG TPA: cellulase family glycosylhydrolase [Gaiellaceae bacterium]|nr:cellulase family glycosylhydrolase [Gaiellaceae bacterium]
MAAAALLPAVSASPATTLSIKVQGNRLVDGGGRAVRLLGVNRASFEYACAQGWGMWEGPTDEASIAAMKSWRINAVRLPLNEACWNGLPNVKPQYRGGPYRQAVLAYVRRLHAAGLYVILDLHWNAPGKRRALGQQRMADADHSPAFWRSVAAAFRRDRAVLFDLYNEPHDISWVCWRNGCRTPGGWKAAGMQQLVNAVRSTGSRHPLLLGGLNWANDLSGWLRWQPRDPARQLVASVHVYETNACGAERCWNEIIAPVAAEVPVVTGEIGQGDCAHDFIDRYMPWADARSISYLAWGWNVWGCELPGLIEDYGGTPTGFGEGFRAHLARLRHAS